jgi:hypothetical protein
MMDNDECGAVGGMIGQETEVLGENLPQCRFVHHKCDMTYLGLNPDRRSGKPPTDHLSYGMTRAGFHISKGMRTVIYYFKIFTPPPRLS